MPKPAVAGDNVLKGTKEPSYSPIQMAMGHRLNGWSCFRKSASKLNFSFQLLFPQPARVLTQEIVM